MDQQSYTQLAVSLADAAARNTATIITSKIKAAKATRDSKKTINELEEIISNLLEVILCFLSMTDVH